MGECVIALRNRIQWLELEITLAERGIREKRGYAGEGEARRGDVGAPVREWREEAMRCRERLAQLEPET